MRIFVTGATGVIGSRAVPLLLGAGHQVTAVARSRERLEPLGRAGAHTLALDLFDRARLREAVAGHDAVVNLATHIPQGGRVFVPGAWRENDRIRSSGSQLLSEVAREAGVGRFIQESFAPIYPDGGDGWISEDVTPRVVRYNRSVLDAEASVGRFTQAGGSGVALRFALFYGAGDSFTRDVLALARRGWLMMFGRPEAYLALVSQDDAAAAVLAALQIPAGIYNVVDDEPLTRQQFAQVLGELLGVATPRLFPGWLTKLSGSLGELLARSLRVSNRKLRGSSAWVPRYPSAREGWAAVLPSFAQRAAP